MFPFAFYSPSSLEHFSHLSLAYATHTVYSAFWAIGIASTRVSCDARLFPSHRFLPSLFHLSPKWRTEFIWMRFCLLDSLLLLFSFFFFVVVVV
jgi:hypothetical protein